MVKTPHNPFEEISVSRSRSLFPVTLALVATFSLSGCLAREDDDRPRVAETSVIQPGGPGEEAATVAPGTEAEEAGFTHDDVAFVQMMIPHHAQALTMSELAPSRAQSRAVKAMARRILAAQRPEILTMGAWLRARNIDVPTSHEDAAEFDHGAHGHALMHGMLTEEQLAALRAARGAEFDRLFLEGMIQHHQGAIDMADAVLKAGEDVQVNELATEIVTGQGAEIQRMRTILTEL